MSVVASLFKRVALTLEPLELNMPHTSIRYKFAPVAEYRGVAILENANGNRRSVWNGVEYCTDGKVHFFGHAEAGMLLVLGFETERDAKEILDDCLVGERLLETADGHVQLMSRDECIRLLFRDDPMGLAEALALETSRIWDDDAGVFVRSAERPPWVEDGQHRHKSNKQ